MPRPTGTGVPQPPTTLQRLGTRGGCEHWLERGDPERAKLERRNAEIERAAAQLELHRREDRRAGR